MDTYRCDECNGIKEMQSPLSGIARIPHGWKRIGGRLLCGTCKDRAYVIRAAQFPVVEPITGNWQEFSDRLRIAWSESTALANWAVSELAKNDVIRTPDMKKLPKMPHIYLYSAMSKKPGPFKYPGRHAWGGASQAVISILHTVERKYNKERLNFIWHRNRSLPTFRYPYPYSVDADGWSVSYGDGNAHLVSICLPQVDCRSNWLSEMTRERYASNGIETLPGGRFVIKVPHGKSWLRQMARFRQFIRGEAVQGELVLYRRGRATMCKLVGHFPRPAPGERQSVLTVCTDPHAFWVAQLDRRTVWVENADHVRVRIHAHLDWLQRIAEDTKHEKRVPRRKMEQIDLRRRIRCRRYHDRLYSFMDMTTASLLGLARRNRVAEVVYVDQDKSYMPSFPWHEVRGMLGRKLEEYGIALTTEEAPADHEE